jgi:hypothetical protein
MDVEFVIQAALASAKTREGVWRIEEVQFTDRYAEPGYSKPEAGIAFGNWNTVSRWDSETRKSEDLDDIMPRLADVLEKLGFELEWCDEWTTCPECGAAVRTQANSYSWRPSHVDGVCLDCLDGESHLQDLEGEANRCNVVSSIHPSEHGYSLIKDRFEHGFHYGQDADPKLIAELLEGIGATRWVFNQDAQGQFDIAFSVWLHEEEAHLLEAAKLALEEGSTDGPSVAAAMERGLQEASRQADELRKEQAATGGVIVSKVGHGTATTRVVSPEDFIAGKALDDGDQEEGG